MWVLGHLYHAYLSLLEHALYTYWKNPWNINVSMLTDSGGIKNSFGDDVLVAIAALTHCPETSSLKPPFYFGHSCGLGIQKELSLGRSCCGFFILLQSGVGWGSYHQRLHCALS